MRCTYACYLGLIVASLQVVETGAALTWAFFAFPTRHFDEKTPLLQACLITLCTPSCKSIIVWLAVKDKAWRQP